MTRPRTRRARRPAGRPIPRRLRHAALLLICAAGVSGAAQARELLAIRAGVWEDRLRVVVDVDAEGPYRYRALTEPARIVIDLPETGFARAEIPVVADWMVRRIRLNALADGAAQIVLDVSREPDYKVFSLPAEGGKPARIVCDVFRPSHPPAPDAERPWVVAIDAGHGGRDPGVVSQRPRLREKDIVLDVARSLARALEQQPGIAARLIRDRDERISLSERVRRAEAMRADVFVSIHVNGCTRRSPKGAEVFFLSLGGATDAAAEELAELENEPVAAEDPLMGEIAELPFAVDLIQTDTIQRSSLMAELCIERLSADALAASRGVKQANFVVLRSCRVPSVLVELGFLSNPEDAQNLASEAHRRSLAESLARGLLEYRARYARRSETGSP